MTAPSNEKACRARTRRRRQQQPSFCISKSMSTRKSSLLLVSVVLSCHWMLAGGASFSSFSSAPSLAPTVSLMADKDASSFQPSLSPTSKSSKSHSKHAKKHKREKSSPSAALPRRKPRTPNDESDTTTTTTTTTPGAFGVPRRGRKRPREPRTSDKRRTQTSSRTRSSPKTAAKRTAFVRDSSSVRTTRSRNSKPKKRATHRQTKSFKVARIHRTTNHKTDGPGVKKAKSHKKQHHRMRSKKAVRDETIPAMEMADPTPPPESTSGPPKRRKRKLSSTTKAINEEGGTSIALDDKPSPREESVQPRTEPKAEAKTTKKKKRRRKSGVLSSNIETEESVSTPETTSSKEELTLVEPEPMEEDSPTKDGIDSFEPKPVVDVESRSDSGQDASDVAIDTADAAEEEDEEEEEATIEALNKESPVSVDGLAGTEAEAVEYHKEGAEVSSASNDQKEEDIEKVASVEGESVDTNTDDAIEETVIEAASEALDDVSLSVQDEVVEENADTIGDEEKGAEIVEEELAHVDEETIAEASDGTAYHEEEETRTVEEKDLQTDVENVDEESIAKENTFDEEGKEVVEEEEERTETIEGKALEVEQIVEESNKVEEESEDVDGQEEEATEIVEEEPTQVDAEIAIDESTEDDTDVDGERDESTEIVQEESPKAELETIEEEPTIDEKEEDAENPELSENEDDENADNTCNPPSSSENTATKKETSRGVSVKFYNHQEISSSEGSDIDPDQDVVSFIEEVLHEDVRSWIKESDSHFENVVNKTRGGHSDSAIDVDDAGVLQVDETIETTISDGVREVSEIAEDDAEVAVKDSTPSIEESKQASIVMDRESLEKLGDKKSDAVVSIVTWNLAEDSPSEEDAAFIRKFRKNGVSQDQGSDLVLISGQECENIKPRRSEGRRSREYRRLMVKMLGKGYVPLALHLLGGIQFGLFAKRSFLDEIEEVSVADVTCGVGNVFHNKGAIAAFVKVKARNDDVGSESEVKRSKSLRMVFVTAHLAAHVKNAEARDSDFWRISSELEAQAPEGFLPRKMSSNRGGSFLFDSVDRVFFCGDLNYRLDLPRELTEHTILHDEASIKDLLRHDQLIHSMAEGRAFPGFGEGKITFLPTFKYDKESSSYDTSHKQRIPAWTDRILFQPSSGIRVLDYQSVPGAQSSDHRPVYGSFRIGMEGRVLSPPPSPRKRKRKRQIESSAERNLYE